MKLDNYNNQQRILDFLKSSGISLSEEGMKQAAEELASYGVINLPIKIGDTLYANRELPFGRPKANKFEVCGVIYDNDEVFRIQYENGGGWTDIDGCFFTYEEAEASAEELRKAESQSSDSRQEREKWWREEKEKEKLDMAYALSEKMKKNCFAGLSSDAINILSSAIVSNGMLVAPIKVGNTVYQVWENDEESWIEEGTVTNVLFNGEWMVRVGYDEIKELSEYILTYEEAERVLNELKSKRQYKK